MKKLFILMVAMVATCTQANESAKRIVYFEKSAHTYHASWKCCKEHSADKGTIMMGAESNVKQSHGACPFCVMTFEIKK